jgi:hypothetical protein
MPDFKTHILDDLSLCCSRTLVCPVCDPYAMFSQRAKQWIAQNLLMAIKEAIAAMDESELDMKLIPCV